MPKDPLLLLLLLFSNCGNRNDRQKSPTLRRFKSFPVMESSKTCPWPRGYLRTHFQVLGLGLGLVAHVLGLGLGLESQIIGLGLVKFPMTHRCTDTAQRRKFS